MLFLFENFFSKTAINIGASSKNSLFAFVPRGSRAFNHSEGATLL